VDIMERNMAGRADRRRGPAGRQRRRGAAGEGASAKGRASRS